MLCILIAQMSGCSTAPTHDAQAFYAAKTGDVAALSSFASLGQLVVIRDRWGKTLLHYAPDKRTVLYLCAHGAQVGARDDRGNTPLHESSFLGRLAACRALLLEGASVSARDNDGNTPLHMAVVGNHQTVVSMLLQAGADINDVGAGLTPLSLAKANRLLEMARFLRARGAR